MAPCRTCGQSIGNNPNQQLQQHPGYLNSTAAVTGVNAFCAFCVNYGSLRALNGYVYGKCSKGVLLGSSVVDGQDVLNKTNGWCNQFKKK